MRSTPAQHYSVLVVDDEPEIRETLSDLLTMHEFDVITAASAAEALTLCKEREIDIVITDIRMPGMSGIELVGALRSDGRTRSTPVLMLTADGSLETLYQGLESGAEDYLTKPFNARELILRMHAQLDSRTRHALALRSAPDKKSFPSSDESFIEQLRAVVDAAMGLNQEVDLSPAHLAHMMAISVPTLHRMIRRLLGMSLGEWLLGYRLERARQMIDSRAGSFAQIAYATGFNGPSYFSFAFRRRYGMTPREYRQHAGGPSDE